MTQECARKREREKRDYKVNTDTKVFPLAGNQSKKLSKNVITKIIVTGRATFQRKKEAGEGKRERETKRNAFDERGERERERERERENAYLDDDGGLDGLHFCCCANGKRDY